MNYNYYNNYNYSCITKSNFYNYLFVIVDSNAIFYLIYVQMYKPRHNVSNYYIAYLYLNTNLVWIYKTLMRSNFYRQVGFLLQ